MVEPMTARIALVALIFAPLLPAQATVDFEKSMLLRYNEQAQLEKIDGCLRILPERIIFVAKKDGQIFEAAYTDVIKLMYEHTEQTRYTTGLLLGWPLLLKKERQHYLTVEAKDSFAYVKMHKNEFQPAIAAIQNSSGLRVQRLND